MPPLCLSCRSYPRATMRRPAMLAGRRPRRRQARRPPPVPRRPPRPSPPAPPRPQRTWPPRSWMRLPCGSPMSPPRRRRPGRRRRHRRVRQCRRHRRHHWQRHRCRRHRRYQRRCHRRSRRRRGRRRRRCRTRRRRRRCHGRPSAVIALSTTGAVAICDGRCGGRRPRLPWAHGQERGPSPRTRGTSLASPPLSRSSPLEKGEVERKRRCRRRRTGGRAPLATTRPHRHVPPLPALRYQPRE